MTAAGVRGSRGPWWEGLRRFRRNRAAAAAVLVIVGASAGGDLRGCDRSLCVSEQLLERSGARPATRWLRAPPGSSRRPRWTISSAPTQLARDIFSRTLVGLRISLAAALFAMVVVTLIGVSVGDAGGGRPALVRLHVDAFHRCRVWLSGPAADDSPERGPGRFGLPGLVASPASMRATAAIPRHLADGLADDRAARTRPAPGDPRDGVRDRRRSARGPRHGDGSPGTCCRTPRDRCSWRRRSWCRGRSSPKRRSPSSERG